MSHEDDDQRAVPTETQRLRSRIEDLTRERDLYKRMLERYEPDPTYSTPTELDRLRAELAETRAELDREQAAADQRISDLRAEHEHAAARSRRHHHVLGRIHAEQGAELDKTQEAGDALAGELSTLLQRDWAPDYVKWVRGLVSAWWSVRGSVPAPDRAGDDEPRTCTCGEPTAAGVVHHVEAQCRTVEELRAGGGVTAGQDEPAVAGTDGQPPADEMVELTPDEWAAVKTIMDRWPAVKVELARLRAAHIDMDALNALTGDVWHAIACGGNDDENMADIYRRLRELLPESLRGRPVEDALAMRPAVDTATGPEYAIIETNRGGGVEYPVAERNTNGAAGWMIGGEFVPESAVTHVAPVTLTRGAQPAAPAVDTAAPDGIPAVELIRIRVTNHGPWHGRRVDVEPGPDGGPPKAFTIQPDETVIDPGTGRVIGRLVPAVSPDQDGDTPTNSAKET